MLSSPGLTNDQHKLKSAIAGRPPSRIARALSWFGLVWFGLAGPISQNG
jgi:hypothetical protein